MMKPLQTHGKYDEQWIPPVSNSRFVRYTAADEHWLRPLGFGSVRRTLCDLYDVRLRGSDCQLVGYVRHNPCECRSRYMRVPFLKPDDASTAVWPRGTCRPVMFEEITLTVDGLNVLGENYLCWAIDSPEDAAKLLESGFIVAIGVDNLHRWISEIMLHRDSRSGLQIRGSC